MLLIYVLCTYVTAVICVIMCVNVFFFKQKTAYEMRISDWSSDVCSSDLAEKFAQSQHEEKERALAELRRKQEEDHQRRVEADRLAEEIGRASCRERVCQYV